jgi:hypothetical protein
VAPVPLQQYEQLSDRSDFEESPSLDAYYAMPAGGGGLPLAAQLDRDLLLQDAFPELSPLDAIVPSAVPDYNASPPTLDSAGAPTTAAPGADIEPVTSRDPIASALGRALSRQWHGSRHAAPTVHVVHETSLLPDPSVWLRAVLPQTRSHWFRAILARSDELTGDPITRMNGYSQIEDWALQTGLIIPLASGNLAYLIKPTVENVQVTSLGIMPENNDWSTASVT